MGDFQIPDVAELAMLDSWTAADMTLRLYKNNVDDGLTADQIAALTVSDFVEADFTGYTPIVLTGGAWVSLGGQPSTVTYSSQSFTSAADQTPQDIYGFFMTYNTGGEIAGFKPYNAAITIQFDGDGVTIIPRLHLSNKEDLMPAGIISEFGGDAAPDGYLLCDGAAVSRTTYADLYEIIGDSFGAGDGSTTFNVPDHRGRMPLGVSSSGTGSFVGETGGSIDHTHSLAVSNGSTGFARVLPLAAGAIAYDQNLVTSWTYDTTFTPSGGGTKAAAAAGVTSGSGLDGDTASSNPPYLACHFIIKY